MFIAIYIGGNSHPLYNKIDKSLLRKFPSNNTGVYNLCFVAHYWAVACFKLGHASGWPERTQCNLHKWWASGQLYICTLAHCLHKLNCTRVCQSTACAAQFPSPPPQPGCQAAKVETAVIIYPDLILNVASVQRARFLFQSRKSLKFAF